MENQTAPQETPQVAPDNNKHQPAPKGGEGLSIAAMVVGILSLLLCWVPILGILLGITAIILGAISLKKVTNKGMSIAGLVTGILTTLSGIVVTILFFLGMASVAILGGGLNQLSEEIEDYTDQQQYESQQITSSKKDFSAGETAAFNDIELEINKITRNATDPDGYYEPADGKEFIVVNVSAKNNSNESQYISDYDFMMNDGGILEYPSYISISPAFDSGLVASGATLTGNIVYEVTRSSTDLKIQHEETIYDYTNYDTETVTYTLDLY